MLGLSKGKEEERPASRGLGYAPAPVSQIQSMAMERDSSQLAPSRLSCTRLTVTSPVAEQLKYQRSPNNTTRLC